MIRLLIAFATKEKQSAAPNRPGLCAGEIRGRGNPAEQDKEVPERAKQALLVFAGHGEQPLRVGSIAVVTHFILSGNRLFWLRNILLGFPSLGSWSGVSVFALPARISRENCQVSQRNWRQIRQALRTVQSFRSLRIRFGYSFGTAGAGFGAGLGFAAGRETPKLINRKPNPLRSESSTLIVSFLMHSGEAKLTAIQDRAYLLVTGVLVAEGAVAAGAWPCNRSIAEGGSGLSALARRMLTCHIWLSVSMSLNDGMPLSRMPLATFQ